METIKSCARLHGVSVRFDGLLALDEVSLDVDPQAFIALIGPNGGGKTTLIRVLLGLQSPASGKVELFGELPTRTRHRVGYVPQTRSFDSNFPISVREVVEMGCLTHFKKRQHGAHELCRKVDDVMAQLELTDIAERPIGTLSGGQLQRALIARALATEPEMLILDEPTASIDPHAVEMIYRHLLELNQRIPIITVSHDIGVVSQYVKTIGCVNQHLHYHASKEITPAMLEEAYGCPIDLLAHGQPHRVLGEHKGHGHA